MAPPAIVPDANRRERFRDKDGNIISDIWKTSEYRVNKNAWTRALRVKPAREPYRGRRLRQLTQAMNSGGPTDGDTVNSVLSWETEKDQCWVCKRQLNDDPNSCGQRCYDWWRDLGPQDRLENDCEIRPLPWNSGFEGHGVYLKNWTPGGAKMPSITRNDMVGEYVGELVPWDREGHDEYEGEAEGRYIFEGPNKRWLIDAGKWGNTSRFINHNCRPNLIAVPMVVGGRRLITFRALKAIKAGDELTIHYGESYFNRYNEKCRCNAKGRPVAHDPEPAP
ncbi:hypothetical protein PG988_007766 [Apiospora saccharicola]